ncbi:hypothetical protein ACWEO2_31695 [Nocardia sp. NPDC004278]
MTLPSIPDPGIDPWDPLSRVSIGIMVDKARESVMVERRAGREPEVLKISPEAHRLLRYVKRFEVQAGRDMALLGKRVQVDDALHDDDVTTELTKEG